MSIDRPVCCFLKQDFLEEDEKCGCFAIIVLQMTKSQILSSVAPEEEKLGYYFQLGTCLGALETHVLLSFLWSVFCKGPVIYVTLLT